jgi:hypothetical protein
VKPASTAAPSSERQGENEMYKKPDAVAGIDLETQRCEIVGKPTDEIYAEIRQYGFIAVPVWADTAKVIFGEYVPDIYAIVSPNA